MQLLLEAIKLAPNQKGTWQTLGTIHQQQGNERAALDALMIAASLGPKARLWPLAPCHTRMTTSHAALLLLLPVQGHSTWQMSGNTNIKIGAPLQLATPQGCHTPGPRARGACLLRVCRQR